MSGPAWLGYSFAAVMLGVALFCAGQIVVAHRVRRPAEIDSDGLHVFMGIAMAGMLVTRLRVGSTAAWSVVFVLLAAWFGWQTVRLRSGAARSPWRCPQPVSHLVECGAMVFMLVVVPGVRLAGGQAAGMAMAAGGSRWSFVALLLVVFMLGYVVWLADQLGARMHVGVVSGVVGGGAAGCDQAGSLAPRCTMCCKIAMGITMGYMLILML